jgi:hypothetical protein
LPLPPLRPKRKAERNFYVWNITTTKFIIVKDSIQDEAQVIVANESHPKPDSSAG